METLKKLRKSKGLTQAELGKILGVSPSTIGMYEQGRRTPDKDALIAISNYFNVLYNSNTLTYNLTISINHKR